MAFYIMWTWAFCHEPGGRCLNYIEEDNFSTYDRLHALFPFCFSHTLLYQGTQNHVSIQLQ